MKRRKNNRNFITIILLLIVGGVVGYAALRTNLTINGQTTVAKNTWSVKFTTITPVKNDGTITSTPTVTGDTTFSFGVKLNTPGDEYKVKVKVENQGTIDAMVSGNPTLSGLSDMDDYLDYSVTYADGIAVEAGNLLAADSEDEIIVTLKFKDDIDASDLADLATADVTKTMVFSMTYAQKDNTASERERVITILKGTRGNLQPGDIIGIGETEDFYVISSDNSANGKTVLLAKYNLLVGNIVEDWSVIGQIQPTSPGYGLQSVDAMGYDGITDYYKGTVAFSSTKYWDNGNGLVSPYNQNGASYSGNPYPYVYDNTYVTEPDFSSACQYDENSHPINNCWATPGYSIAYYVELYKTKLIEMGVPSTITGRLLSYEEATSTQNIQDNGHSIIFDGHNTYWFGSGKNSGNIWKIHSGDPNITYDSYSYDYFPGVRPVIEILTSDI